MVYNDGSLHKFFDVTLDSFCSIHTGSSFFGCPYELCSISYQLAPQAKAGVEMTQTTSYKLSSSIMPFAANLLKFQLFLHSSLNWKSRRFLAGEVLSRK